ncbi:MAG: acylphosphatase [Acidobacteriota bacterium]|nr:acylphosphatase [Acidobacteriota bacterium]
MVRRRVLVRGRVQGVGFRMSCARRARDLELGGSVRNRPDGTVEAVFEGPAGAVERMVDWCRTGPPLAHVTGVTVDDEVPAGVAEFAVA